MATPDFNKIFSTNAPSTPFTWTDSDYLEGWDSIQNTPPSRQQFNALQMLSDLKAKYLMDIKAPIHSPTFTGDPKAPTPAKNDNDTSIATTEFVHTWVEELSSDIDDNGAGIVAYKKGNPGYIKFKNGVIVQWGKITTPDGWTSVPLPISFSNTSYAVVGTDIASVSGNGFSNIAIDGSSSSSQLKIAGQQALIMKVTIVGWIAVGY